MRTKINILVVLILVNLAHFLRAEKVEVSVLDEDLEHVKGATVDVWYAGFQGDGSGDTNSSGTSDESGKYIGKGIAAMHIEVHVSKNGWYASKSKMLAKGKDHNITLGLRKIKNPIPLFVRDVFLKFPVFDEWLGFDFEVGDWVAPQGRGKSRDILFKFHREFKGYKFSEKKMEEMKFPDTTEADLKKFYGKWDGVLWIAFPAELEGIIEEKSDYLPYSKMKMPHLAPEEGYQGEEMVIKNKSYHTEKDERASLAQMREYVRFGVPESKPSGYYIRTRVVEVGGKVIKANYVKLPKMIGVGPAGSINFTYYFNPTPNDRNLEYRPGSNLASEQKREYEP